MLFVQVVLTHLLTAQGIATWRTTKPLLQGKGSNSVPWLLHLFWRNTFSLIIHGILILYWYMNICLMPTTYGYPGIHAAHAHKGVVLWNLFKLVWVYAWIWFCFIGTDKNFTKLRMIKTAGDFIQVSGRYILLGV